MLFQCSHYTCIMLLNKIIEYNKNLSSLKVHIAHYIDRIADMYNPLNNNRTNEQTRVMVIIHQYPFLPDKMLYP